MKGRQLLIGVLILSVGAALAWAGKRWLSTDYTFSLVYTGGLMGELEPCGCAEETDLGGIRRRATMLDALRRDRPDLILVSAGGLIASNTWQDQIKAKYILRAFGVMGYDSIGVQWRDRAYGDGFLQADDARWISSSSTVEGVPFSRFLKRENGVVAHFSWLDPNGARDGQARQESGVIAQDAARLNAELADAQMSGAVTLLSTTVAVEDLAPLVQLELVDLLVTASADERYHEPEKLGTTLVLRYGTRGMRIAKLDFSVDGDRHIAAYRHDVHVLRKSVADAASLEAWYAAYNDEIKETYRAMAERRKALESDDNRFTGERVCAACHRTAHAVWSATKHADAFHSLETVDKQFDPYCVACHTVGFNEPGGFIDLSVSEFLSNVQCESCHGAGREHVSSGGARATPNAGVQPADTCLRCHYGDHSPNFALESYWSDIAHTREPN
jgi:hypothetical protein